MQKTTQFFRFNNKEGGNPRATAECVNWLCCRRLWLSVRFGSIAAVLLSKHTASSSVKKMTAVTQLLQQAVQGKGVKAVIRWLSPKEKATMGKKPFVGYIFILRGGGSTTQFTYSLKIGVKKQISLSCCSQCFSYLEFNVIRVSSYCATLKRGC